MIALLAASNILRDTSGRSAQAEPFRPAAADRPAVVPLPLRGRMSVRDGNLAALRTATPQSSPRRISTRSAPSATSPSPTAERDGRVRGAIESAAA